MANSLQAIERTYPAYPAVQSKMSSSVQIAIPQLSIPKLQGETNYTPRTSKVKLALLQEDLWRIATGAEKQPGPWYDKEDNERSPTAPEQQQLDKWTTRATRASTIILLALEDGPYEHVSDMASEETPEPQPGHMAPSAPNSPVAKYRKTMTVPTVEHCPPLQVKKLSPKGRAPTRGSAFAAGYDIYSAHDTTIPARGKALVDTGIAVAVTVLLFNHSDTDFKVAEGDRIAQLVLERIYTPEVVEVEELEESVRGAGGFGSTG
ncbi:MAG: Deoxyuridine 5'-triphosphate nucleotidohydrolase [Geoglossum simile]|nr:MAG: Deoxyuridine 5'-triphosphate nucleotidohydrolase [Geoglossum simile]